MSSIEQIQQNTIQTYIKNLKYFEKNHPKLFEKISLFDIAINEGKYQEKYTLEYKEDGYFDVKVNQTGEYLYAENSLEYSKKLSSYVNKSKEDKVIEGFYRHYFTKHQVEVAKNSDPTSHVNSCVLPIIDFVNEHLEGKNYLKHIKKFIFFGTGLGFHLNLIDQKIKEPAIYLILDDDLELFRLSLFVNDYEKLANKNDIFFAILENNENLREIFNNFFDMGFLHNNYLKYLMFFDSYKEKFKLLQSFIVGQSYLGYTYDRLLKKYILSLKPIKEDYRFLNVSDYFQDSIFKTKPVIFLAAGPSLQKNIDWLKKNQDKFIIICAFMILPILQKENIVPDVILHIDEQYTPIKRVLEKVNLNKFAKDAFFIMAPGIDIDWFKKYNLKERTFLLEDRTHYKLNHGHFHASSVGETGYALSLIFDAREIYLLGLDLAFDEESGKSHIDSHDGGMNIKNKSENVSLRETYIKVKGNFRKEVTTNPLFYDSILDANIISDGFKKEEQKVYNLNDGAYIKKTIPLYPKNIRKDLKKIDKKELKNKIKKTLIENSSTITNDEIELFKIRYKKIQQKKSILTKFLKLDIKNQEDFINNFIKISIKLTVNKEKNISQVEQVLSVYLHYIGVYVSEFSNTAGVKFDKKTYKKFQKILVDQFNRILNKYEDSIKEIIKK